MSADNYLLVRRYRDGFLVTQEFLSCDEPSDADEAYERAMSPNSKWTDGFFDSESQAEDFVDLIYDIADEDGRPFEYGSEWL